MTIQIVSVKNQMKAHLLHAKSTAKLDLERHILACEDLLHCATHGDVSLCKHLYDVLGGEKSAQRSATLKQWFVLMSGNQMTAEKGEWKMKKGWTKDKFTLDVAEEQPYWTLGGEKAPVNLSFEAIMAILKGFGKKIDNAVKNDTFNGDSVAVKSIIDGVVNFAEERAKRLTAQQLGTVSNQADAILKEGEVWTGPIPGAITAAQDQSVQDEPKIELVPFVPEERMQA